MTSFQDSKIKNIVIHFVGNSNKNEELLLSNSNLIIDSTKLHSVLSNYLTSCFLNIPEQYEFSHHDDIELNEIYKYTNDYFEKKIPFISYSKKIAKSLFEKSTHPNTKGGDFYVVHFTNCYFNNNQLEAIGLYKIESKTTFLKSDINKDSSNLLLDEGINSEKFIDKGCLIVNTKGKNKYTVLAIDNLNKSNNAFYWKNEFLNLSPIENEFFQTTNILSLCKDFVNKTLPESYEITKAEQAVLLNQTIDYFKTESFFDSRKFQNEVLKEKEFSKLFSEFKTEFEENNNIRVSEEFRISQNAVKKQSAKFKSILKLDKNFHVYIHGDNNLIEKGYDKILNKSFYKIYFDEEQ